MENVKVIYFRSRYENLVNTLELCRHVVVSVVSTLNQIPLKVSSMIPFKHYSEVVYAENKIYREKYIIKMFLISLFIQFLFSIF